MGLLYTVLYTVLFCSIRPVGQLVSWSGWTLVKIMNEMAMLLEENYHRRHCSRDEEPCLSNAHFRQLSNNPPFEPLRTSFDPFIHPSSPALISTYFVRSRYGSQFSLGSYSSSTSSSAINSFPFPFPIPPFQLPTHLPN